ncbi:MAG TPA: hypothetical protein VGC77_04235 [Rhodopseudomonas sp.]|uniref:hypothetical protein n=1 Tax=Rhodopseudomonas sp. TaxID=1078 RepID=UPI002ED9223F
MRDRPALIASIPHNELRAAFHRRPPIGFALWRETLIDAAIFREAITDNSARTMPARMAPVLRTGLSRSRLRLAPGKQVRGSDHAGAIG